MFYIFFNQSKTNLLTIIDKYKGHKQIHYVAVP